MSAPAVSSVPFGRVIPTRGAQWQVLAALSCAVQALLMLAVVALDLVRLLQGQVINAGRVGVMMIVVLCGVAWVAAVALGVWRLRRACLVPGLVWCMLWLPVAWQVYAEAQQWLVASVISALVGTLAVSLFALNRLGIWMPNGGSEEATVW